MILHYFLVLLQDEYGQHCNRLGYGNNVPQQVCLVCYNHVKVSKHIYALGMACRLHLIYRSLFCFLFQSIASSNINTIVRVHIVSGIARTVVQLNPIVLCYNSDGNSIYLALY